MPFQPASSSSSSRGTSAEESTQVWPLRRHVTTVRPSASSARMTVPSTVDSSASSGLIERVAADHGVGDLAAVLLVEHRARLAPADLVGARAGGLPAELPGEVGEHDVVLALAQHLRLRRHRRDRGRRRLHGGRRHVLDVRPTADEHDRGEHRGERPGQPAPGHRIPPSRVRADGRRSPWRRPGAERASTRVRRASGAPVDSAAVAIALRPACWRTSAALYEGSEAARASTAARRSGSR